MKKRLVSLAIIAAILLSAGVALADGDFYVVAVGGGVGTKITSLPYTISSPGFYYLSGNLTFTGSTNGITISSDDVTLDLMGFRLSGPGSNGSNSGIRMIERQNVEIRNGTLSGWYGGIYGDNGGRHRAINVRVENCAFGIYFGGGVGQFLVKGCIVDVSTGGYGIYLTGGTASGNMVSNSGVGIDLHAAGNVLGNSVVTPSGQNGIMIGTNEPALVDQNTVSGAGTRFVGGTGTVKTLNNAGF